MVMGSMDEESKIIRGLHWAQAIVAVLLTIGIIWVGISSGDLINWR